MDSSGIIFNLSLSPGRVDVTHDDFLDEGREDLPVPLTGTALILSQPLLLGRHVDESPDSRGRLLKRLLPRQDVVERCVAEEPARQRRVQCPRVAFAESEVRDVLLVDPALVPGEPSVDEGRSIREHVLGGSLAVHIIALADAQCELLHSDVVPGLGQALTETHDHVELLEGSAANEMLELEPDRWNLDHSHGQDVIHPLLQHQAELPGDGRASVDLPLSEGSEAQQSNLHYCTSLSSCKPTRPTLLLSALPPYQKAT